MTSSPAATAIRYGRVVEASLDRFLAECFDSENVPPLGTPLVLEDGAAIFAPQNRARLATTAARLYRADMLLTGFGREQPGDAALFAGVGEQGIKAGAVAGRDDGLLVCLAQRQRIAIARLRLPHQQAMQQR